MAEATLADFEGGSSRFDNRTFAKFIVLSQKLCRFLISRVDRYGTTVDAAGSGKDCRQHSRR
jgi:hypothetical protein